jgi:hypothetical protein
MLGSALQEEIIMAKVIIGNASAITFCDESGMPFAHYEVIVRSCKSESTTTIGGRE